MPKWIRTMRIQRDIPSSLIEAGVKKSDLGELVYQRLKEQNWRCRCIKCRDVGHLQYKEGVRVEDEHIEILSEGYQASKGIEHFISVEDTKNDVLIAYLRLRFPSHKAHRKEINESTSLVRELRVLGPVVPIGERLTEAKQHMGLGSVLLQKAEEFSAENGMKNILITSAIGTREYYKRFGYKRKGAYMGKRL
jgi:elongator complex protein 3